MSDQQPLPPSSAAPPPGWYPDQQGATRWWDGAAWGQVAEPGPSARWGRTAEADQPAQWNEPAQWGQASAAPLPVAQPYAPQQTASIQDEKTMAVLAHALAIVAGFVGPLIIYLVAKPEQTFARHHASEALNFAILLFIATMVSFILMFVLIGFVLIFVVLIGGLVIHVMAAMAANRGEWYRYPISVRLVPGAAV